MLKEFLLKKMLQSKLKDVPPEQQEKILKAFDKNPDLFVKIAEEIKTKTSGGADQMTVAMEVLKSHQGEIAKLIQ
ncbi:MAG: hypothetical protein Q7S86_02240 [bacterium]|nr:hypothetical protein [bacterium]